MQRTCGKPIGYKAADNYLERELRRDLVSAKDPQQFTDAEKQQARENIGLELITVNDITGRPLFQAAALL